MIILLRMWPVNSYITKKNVSVRPCLFICRKSQLYSAVVLKNIMCCPSPFHILFNLSPTGSIILLQQKCKILPHKTCKYMHRIMLK